MRLLLRLIIPLVLISGNLLGQNPCASDLAYHIIVMGSSTAAGAGSSHPDSAWVNRYRAYSEALNPANQVTNLAVGGYSTYRLMPTGFVPPAGRPAVDTLKNITWAIAQNPDAIIVNLPSNDVSLGFSVAEQMNNWDTIHGRATAAGIPIWICTTQPKNYSNNPIPIQKQQDVRDSIIARYSPRVLDFWTGLADSTNQLDSYYDSGDGTHLNDIGHRSLFNRVKTEDIHSQLYVPPSFVDFVAADISPVYFPVCGDSNSVFRFKTYNRGIDHNGSVSASLEHWYNGGQHLGQGVNFSIGNSCIMDSLDISFNTAQPGTHELRLVMAVTADGNSSNDTLSVTFTSLGLPIISTESDTACKGLSANLMAIAGPQDSLRWFDQSSGGTALATGTNFSSPPLTQNTTYYVEAVRGDFVFRDQISTTLNSNINFNGTMFDLVADSTLIIDSLASKINSLGPQIVEIYTTQGSHRGRENNVNFWNHLGSFPVTVASDQLLTTIPIPPVTINAGDTLGLYVHMQNSGSRLSYQSVGQPITRIGDAMKIITGSGIAHTFGTTYYPRDWNGNISYHYGNKPDGDCVSPRVPVTAFIGGPDVDLGRDTILSLTSSITLDAGPGMTSYNWSTGGTGQTETLQGSQLGTGIYPISVSVTDDLGCDAGDTIIVVFAPLANLNELRNNIDIWPNPSHRELHINFPLGHWKYSLLDLQGRQLIQENLGQFHGEHSLQLNQLPTGVYSLQIWNDNDLIQMEKLIISP